MSSKKHADPNAAQAGQAGPKKEPVAPTGKDASEEYGKEGTNKTIAQPKPDNAPSEELGHTPHVSKSPYTRG